MAENNDSTPRDDASDHGATEQELLNNILQRTDFLDGESFPEPVEELSEEEQEDLEGTSEDTVNDDDEESGVEEDIEDEEVEEDGAEAPTGDDTYVLDDLEDIMVTHKVDGEDVTLPLSEWVTGSATKQHLSKQGRELGEARKALEVERAQKLGQLDQLSAAVTQTMMGAENAHAAEYNKLKQDIDRAEREDDTYELGELTKKQKNVQRNYWNARNQREQLSKAASQQKAQHDNQVFAQSVEQFQRTIPDVIPDWSNDVQMKVREFALEEGISEDLLNVITDPALVKFVDDYRRLKKGVTKGSAKRKAVSTKRVPAKRNKSDSKKKVDAEKMTKVRAFREDSSKDDQMAFLRQHASKTLKGL